MKVEQRQTGVTFLEMLIVMAIAAILAVIAAPSFGEFINNTRLSSTMTQLVSDLNRARVEAIKRNTWMLFCVRSATGSCGTGTSWNNGWVVCRISNSAATACDDSTTANPNPIVVHQAINVNHTLTGPAVPIRFNPNGTQGAGASATLALCCKPNSTDNSGLVRIAATGHISRE